MEHGLKDIAFYVQLTYNTLHSCHNFPAGSQQAARGARIYETSLLALQGVSLSFLRKDFNYLCHLSIAKW